MKKNKSWGKGIVITLGVILVFVLIGQSRMNDSTNDSTVSTRQEESIKVPDNELKKDVDLKEVYNYLEELNGDSGFKVKQSGSGFIIYTATFDDSTMEDLPNLVDTYGKEYVENTIGWSTLTGGLLENSIMVNSLVDEKFGKDSVSVSVGVSDYSGEYFYFLANDGQVVYDMFDEID